MSDFKKEESEREDDFSKCRQQLFALVDRLKGPESDVSRLKAFLNELCDNARRAFIGRMFFLLLPYKEYLTTHHWDEKRMEAMKRAGFKCMLCNAGGCELHTHHRTYDNIGHEDPADLICLCDKCHSKFHDKQPQC